MSELMLSVGIAMSLVSLVILTKIGLDWVRR